MLSANNMQEQLKHSQVKFNNPSKIKIDIFLDQIDSPANLGSIFRNSEAFAVENIYVHILNIKDLDSNRFKRTSRSTEKRVNIIHYENYEPIFKTFEGLKIGLEITTDSKNIISIQKRISQRILFVLGNEKSGISKKMLQELDEVYHINMFGINSSLNVSQTLGIALHEIRR